MSAQHYKRGSPEAVCRVSDKSLREDEVGYWDRIAKAAAWHLHDLERHHSPLVDDRRRPTHKSPNLGLVRRPA
jgi:hypothetical protein